MATARTALWRGRHRSLWLLGLSYMLLALAAVWMNDPTTWIGDNRFEIFANPGRRLDRMLTLWDASRGLGTVQAEVWIGNTVPFWLMQKAGLSIAVAQHLWHAALLTVAGTSAAAFLRCFIPRIGLAHVVTGLLYMFGPFAVGFLLPSNLFQNYAAAPLLFLFCYRGVHSLRPSKWAAGFALAIAFLGIVDTPGVLYVGLYLVPIIAYAVLVDRSTTWAAVGRWIGRAGPLTLLVMAGPLFAATVGQELFDQNIRETESPLALNFNSSWSESWRGLGGWLLYFRDQTGVVKPQAQVYLSNFATVLATFAAPVAAVAMVAFGRSRVRLLFGFMMIGGLALMVGQFPINDPSPLGEFVRWLYNGAPRTQVLRSTYKAGSGAMFGVSALAGLALAAAIDRSKDFLAALGRQIGDVDPRLAKVPAAVAGIAFVLVTQPFWRTGLYEDTQLSEIPSYVDEAYAWVDEQPGSGRVLFLPRTYRAEFRWGNVNDDILDAKLSRPHVVEVPIHLSRPIPATVLTAVDDSLDDRRYKHGDIASYALRLGLDFVVVRNDLVWENWELPRPAEFSELRTDPALELVATFGAVGQNTTAPSDTSALSNAEKLLPPVEVYRIRAPGSIVRVEPWTRPLLVSGDGEVWPLLTKLGLLDNLATPIRFTGELDAEELGIALSEGAPLLITDSNRRRADLITLSGRQTYTLPLGGQVERLPYDLFRVSGAETVASYGDVANITNLGETDANGIISPWYRPAAAIDQDRDTAWYTGRPVASGEGIRMELVGPKAVGEMTMQLGLDPDSERELRTVEVRLSDGYERIVSFEDGVGTVNFEGRTTSWIEIELVDVSSPGEGLVGLSDIQVDGLRLEERINTPSDVFTQALAHPALARSMVRVPLAYLFERSIGSGDEPEERTMRRAFVAPTDLDVTLRGQLRIDSDMGGEALAGLLNDAIATQVSSRLRDQLRFGGQSAVDGATDTAWVFEATPGAWINLRFTRQPVDNIYLDLRSGNGLAAVTTLTVDDGTDKVITTFEAQDCEGQCSREVVIPLGGRNIDQVRITIDRIDSPSSTSAVRIDEIRLNGVSNVAGSGGPGCTNGVLSVNGADVPLRLEGDRVDILAGRPTAAESCSTVELQAGLNNLDGATTVLIDHLLVASLDFAPPTPADAAIPTVTVTARDRSTFSAVVDAPAGATLISGQSWHPAWRARVDGVDLGKPIRFDTFAAWELPAGTEMNVEVWFALQRQFEIALWLSSGGGAICIWLIVRRERP